MIFNVTGGGGAALNFKVVGYATEEALLAAAPAENTIGIITETPITGYIFSVEEPSPATAGLVWVIIGKSSQVAFNALKKNTVMVYPLSAKQYIDGAWVDVSIKIYQGSKWIDFKINLLLTTSFAKAFSHGSNISYHLPTAEEPYISISTTYTSSSAQGKLLLCSEETYDLTNVETIEFVVDKWTLGNTSYPFRVGVASTVPSNFSVSFDAVTVITNSINEPTTIKLDVSALYGSYYIVICSEGSYDPIVTTGGTIPEIYLI